jgi:transposase
VRPGNPRDKTTLTLFLERIQTQYGQAHRIWIMDRGIPTEETWREMRQRDPPGSYWVGTPRARGDQCKDPLEKAPWQKLRDPVEVKRLAHGDEV